MTKAPFAIKRLPGESNFDSIQRLQNAFKALFPDFSDKTPQAVQHAALFTVAYDISVPLIKQGLGKLIDEPSDTLPRSLADKFKDNPHPDFRRLVNDLLISSNAMASSHALNQSQRLHDAYELMLFAVMAIGRRLSDEGLEVVALAPEVPQDPMVEVLEAMMSSSAPSPMQADMLLSNLMHETGDPECDEKSCKVCYIRKGLKKAYGTVEFPHDGNEPHYH